MASHTEPCNCRRFQRVNAESAQLSTISGGQVLNVCNCQLFHAHNGVAGGVVTLASHRLPRNCRRFQRLNAESAQLSTISGGQVLKVYNCQRFHVVRRWRCTTVCDFMWSGAASVQLSTISMVWRKNLNFQIWRYENLNVQINSARFHVVRC